MAIDQRLHHVALLQEFIPVHCLKLQRITLAFNPVSRFPAAEIPGIVVKRQTINGTECPRAFTHDLFEKTSCPIPTIVVGAGGNERQWLSVTRHPRRVPAKFNGIFLRSEIPTASPGL